MPVSFVEDKKKTSADAPYFEEVTGDAGFRGYSTQKSEDQLMANITAALGRLGGAIVSMRRGKWIDSRGRSRFIYDFTFSMPGPGQTGAVLGNIQVAAFPLRKWTEKKELQARKMALYVLLDLLENTFNYQRVAPHETATLIPFMMNAEGVTLSEAYISGKINSGLLLSEKSAKHRDERQEDILDAEEI